MNSKIYLVGMSGPRSLKNIEELIDPIKQYFDGVVWVLHDSRGSEEDKYLETVKGRGEIIHTKYVRRHDFSRNHYLYSGPIKNGYWCVQVDDKERIFPDFAARIPELVSQLQSQGLNAAWYYGKPFLFEYHESLQYAGNPHEGLRRLDGLMKGAEISAGFPDEKEVRYSVRDQNRDKHHFVAHYASYMLFPMSNHSLLGLADRGDPNSLWPQREKNRLAFISEMEKRGYRADLDGLNALFREPLDDKLRLLINSDKVWQDYYRFYILNDDTVEDEHKWVSMKSI